MTKSPTHPNPVTPAQQQFIVRWNGNYAVQFHCRGFSLVADDEATVFDTESAAEDRMANTISRGAAFTIEPIPQSQIANQKSKI